MAATRLGSPEMLMIGKFRLLANVANSSHSAVSQHEAE
jgi:hypothetical protein